MLCNLKAGLGMSVHHSSYAHHILLPIGDFVMNEVETSIVVLPNALLVRIFVNSVMWLVESLVF